MKTELFDASENWKSSKNKQEKKTTVSKPCIPNKEKKKTVFIITIM